MAGSLRRNAVWQLLQTLGSTGAELLIVLVLAAALESTAFGRFVVALSLCKLVFLLFEGRLHEFLTPKLSRYLGRSRSGAWMWTRWSMQAELVLNLAGFAACCLAATTAPALSSQFDTPLLLAAAAYNGSNTFLKFSSLAVLRCLGEVRVAAIVSLTVGALKLSALAYALQSGWSLPLLLTALSAMALAASMIQAGVAVSRLSRQAGKAPRPACRPLRHGNLRAQRALLASNYATGLVELMHRELDVQIAAWLSGPEVAGRYRLAKTLAMTMLEALNPVVLVLLPDLSRRLAIDTFGAVAAFLRKISRALTAIALAMAAAVILSTMAYFRWFAPQQAQAWVPTMILVAILTAISPWMWCQAFLVAAGRPQGYLKSSAIGAALACASAFVLVPVAGAAGSVMAYGLGLVATTLLARSAARAVLEAGTRGAA
jgi:O-antigen/teichoic acid export membrane protein